jgi:excinuclease ABC subunit A
MQEKITIQGARVHNLKNINLEIPRNKLVVMTGLSGSGKSSLAFDTIYAEGQRRYVESLSAYARQFLGLMDKPDVDKIEGLSPAISIDQKSASHNPRSTVGTVTEIYDYLRLLFARTGVPHCHVCGKKITGQTVTQMSDQIMAYPKDTKIIILAPMVKDQKGEHKHLLEEAQKSGYQRVRFDGVIMDVTEALELKVDKKKKHTIDVVVDRIALRSEDRTRVADSLETALDLGNDSVIIVKNPPERLASSSQAGEKEAAQAKPGRASHIEDGREVLLSSNFACPLGHMNLPEVNPRNFSFNSPHGACPDCTGLGTRLEIDPGLVIPNQKLTLAEGAIRPWSKTTSRLTWYGRVLEALAREYKFSVNTPAKDLSKKHIDIVLFGSGKEKLKIVDDSGYERFTTFEGVVPNLMRRYRETDSDYMRSEIEQYMRVKKCPTCKGKRLKPEFLAVTIEDVSIIDVAHMSIDECVKFISQLPKKFSDKNLKIAHQILKEIIARLKFLQDVGLNYLTLDRSAATLSGGEAQRIRLATQIGSGLTGVLYILDEPSIGLHQRDNARLLQTLKNLRDLGNTVMKRQSGLLTGL